MSNPTQIPETWLQAFIDGELPEQDRRAVEHALAADPELASQLSSFRADKEQLQAVYDRILDGPVPSKWIEKIERPAMPLRFPMVKALAAAITFFALLIGGTFVYRQQSAPHEEPIVEEALAASGNTLPPDRQIAVRDVSDAAAGSHALATALAMRLKAPDLSRMGYRLASVEVYDHVPGGKAVELLYRRSDNRTFALYVRHATGAARFDEFTRGRMRICIWQDEVLGTVMSGQMSAAEMQRLASLAYSGLEA